MASNQESWFLKSTFPVLFPTHPALTLPSDEFDTFLKTELTKEELEDAPESKPETDDSFTMVSTGQSTTAELRGIMNELGVEELSSETATRPAADTEATSENGYENETSAHPFIEGLTSHDRVPTPGPKDLENKMFTENFDIAHRSTREPLLDLFVSVEKAISGPHLLELLNASWANDPLLTLKIIFNARSIHLGKAERTSFYRCAGWLAQNHPLTLVSNLCWLSRPVIEKKVVKKEGEGEEDVVLVEAETDRGDATRFDVKNGVSHGYWKDLLNILALSASGLLTVLANPSEILNTEKEGKKGDKVDKEAAKARRNEVRDDRHQKAVRLFDSDSVHRALHITIARLFAEQLKSDLALLHSDDPKARKRVSLCAKWAPSHNRFHDKHTFVVSTIAELLHPMIGEMDRELYLRNARELYRKDISSLRQHLDVVERNLSAKTLDKIKYDRVPSVAMQNYAPIFEKKDTDRFNQYIEDVAAGKLRISGATLLPSALVKAVRQAGDFRSHSGNKHSGNKHSGNKHSGNKKVNVKVVDAQWKTLVQRIRDSGTLESSIAVCDVSGSMQWPTFADETVPMDSAIGLSLLVAEVTAPPFGGSFITFSQTPTVQTFDVALPLSQKYNILKRAAWSMNTNFVAVFEDLILPVAVRNKLRPEGMVKRIFVFSDMQFDQAEAGSERWTTSFERIKKKFADAGYEMPQMVFWNLAGGKAGYRGAPREGDPAVPKPVTAEDDNTAIVSGYSQGMLKVFLDGGSFDDLEEEEKKEEEDAEDEETKDKEVGTGENEEEKEGSPAKKRKIDPLSTVKKAVRHKAYDMLKVLD